jgi:hypothetical protein
VADDLRARPVHVTLPTIATVPEKAGWFEPGSTRYAELHRRSISTSTSAASWSA